MDIVFKDLIQNIPAVFYRCANDATWTMHFISDAIESLSGYPADDFILNKTRTYTSIIHPDDLQPSIHEVLTAIKLKQPWDIQFRVIHKDGSIKWAAEKGIGVTSEQGDVLFLDGFITDITEWKNRQQVRDMAYHDSLTGIPNRNLFNDRLDQTIAHSQRDSSTFALMFIDLDNFKAVNDSYGHLIGDKLLTMTAARIMSMTRKSDTVARYGGDEFLIIVENVSDNQILETLANKILQALAQPYLIERLELNITASIGIALSSKNGNNTDLLLKRADTAMYQAKEHGKNQFSIFTAPPHGLKA
jgi:diguanylate cyclase (GGDEF)-like protein/PAS domain S-box-containing protein